VLVAIGDLAWHIYDAFAEYARSRQTAVYCADKEKFLSERGKILSPGDTVLVKASRGMAFETIADALTKEQIWNIR
jgi:UDP-N-acetylmuramyl pentapeptide synthase